MVKETLAARVAALRQMTVEGLRQKYREAFGEESRSRNKEFLWKRVAWRIQAQEEGDISERVRRRAAELARDEDVRVRAPKGARCGKAGSAAGERTKVVRTAFAHDPRLPVAGTVLTRAYKGRTLHVTVLDDGFAFEGRTYRSLSSIATEVTGARWNGFLFFGLTAPRQDADAVAGTAGARR